MSVRPSGVRPAPPLFAPSEDQYLGFRGSICDIRGLLLQTATLSSNEALLSALSGSQIPIEKRLV